MNSGFQRQLTSTLKPLSKKKSQFSGNKRGLSLMEEVEISETSSLSQSSSHNKHKKKKASEANKNSNFKKNQMVHIDEENTSSEGGTDLNEDNQDENVEKRLLEKEISVRFIPDINESFTSVEKIPAINDANVKENFKIDLVDSINETSQLENGISETEVSPL